MTYKNVKTVLFSGLITAMILPFSGMMADGAFTTSSPKFQLESGVLPEDITCKDSRVLVIRTNGSPACVTERTAERTGWKILKTEFNYTENTIPEPTITPERVTPTIIIIDQSSDVEFVDDGREIFYSKLQASAPPRNYYNNIMTHLSNHNSVFSNDGKGVITVNSIPHEKYSLKENLGFYLEDWLPGFVPEGQILLYSGTAYHENGDNHSVVHKYVPTTFELTPETTTYDLRKSQGFTITITRNVDTPMLSSEYYAEYHKDRLAKSEGNVGGYVDMTRDGKFVSAYSGSNKYNHYQATISFHPDEYTSVGVHSYYHTLDELLPIFNSVMKESKESNTPVESVTATNAVINSFDVSSYNSALHGSALYDTTSYDTSSYDTTPDYSTFDPRSEIAVSLNREKILYGSENIILTVVYPINNVPRYGVMNSDGNYLLYPSMTFNKDPNSGVSSGFHMGHAAFGKNNAIGKTWEPGEYTVIVIMNDIKIRKNFTITNSTSCCDSLLQFTPDIYYPGDRIVFYPKTAPLTISLIDPDGETYSTKTIDKFTYIGFSIKPQLITLSEIPTPGVWTLESTDGNITNSVQLLVIPPPEGQITQPTKDIITLYNEALANKKPGHDVLLVSSLEPYDDDGREYPRSSGMGGGHQKDVYDDISYIMKSSPFSVNDKGIVTVKSTDHERYSAQKGGGFYLEDWLPTHIPDGYKLLYAKTNDNALLNFNSTAIGNSIYQFVPTDYVLSGVTYRDLDLKVDGFKISVYRSTELNQPIEEMISSTKKDRETKKQLETHPRFAGTYSYGGFVDMTRDGKTVYAFEGSNSFGAHKTILIFHPDEYTRVIVSSFYLTMDELLPVFNSILDYDIFEQTWGHVEVVRPEPKLVTYSDLYGNPLNIRGVEWFYDQDNVGTGHLPYGLPQYVPDALELGGVLQSFDSPKNKGVEQISLWYVPMDSDLSIFENTVSNGMQITFSDFVKYDENLIRSFADEKSLTLHEFNGRMALSAEFENGSYLLFYDEQTQIELYSQKYNLDVTTKMAESLIGID